MEENRERIGGESGENWGRTRRELEEVPIRPAVRPMLGAASTWKAVCSMCVRLQGKLRRFAPAGNNARLCMHNAAIVAQW